eukprot:12431535-Karenia_brevis.AAC.1
MYTLALKTEPTVWEAKYHVGEILDYILSWAKARNKRILDMFCGIANMFKVWSEENGHPGYKFDIVHNPKHDMTTKEGFFLALDNALELEAGGMHAGGPPCSLFIFLSSSIHKRTKIHPEGDTSVACVRKANVIAENYTVLLVITTTRGVKHLLEQPGSSRFFDLKYVNALLTKIPKTAKWTRMWTWMRCFGHRLPKPSVLWSDMDTAKTYLKKTWSKQRGCAYKESIVKKTRLMTLYKVSVKKGLFLKRSIVQRRTEHDYYHGSPDGSWINGGADLSKSGQYCIPFCQAVFQAWCDWRAQNPDKCGSNVPDPSRAEYEKNFELCGFPVNNVALPKPKRTDLQLKLCFAKVATPQGCDLNFKNSGAPLAKRQRVKK